MIRRFLSWSSLLLLSTCVFADDKNATWSDPVEAAAKNPDFSVQGEYSGKIGDHKAGVQVIALGQEGKFDVVFYPGGLPGDGFSGDKTTRLKGTIAGGKVALPGMNGSVEKGKLVFEKGTLEKVERKSPTLGAAPPAGALVLFDGKNAEAFPGAKLDGDTLIQGITSKQKFQNFSAHVEFRTPYMPAARGQGRGNSGCYMQGRYEVQILDSFGLEGENNECGGIYTIKTPEVNMALPPLVWQTYDIDYTAAIFDAAGKKTANAKATVKHNGVLVHKDAELTHATTSAPLAEGPEPGPLYFQDHGTPVRYRNIWVVEKKN